VKRRVRALVRALPPRVSLSLLALVGTLEWWLRPSKREHQLERMELLLRGTAREGETRKLARRSLRRARGLHELLWRYEVSADAHIEGAETLDGLRAAGRGVIVAHTHLCCIAPPIWALAAQGLADVVVLTVDDPPEPEQLHWRATLGSWGVDPIPAAGSFGALEEHLRQGRICHIALDVPGHTPCVFLDKPAHLASGIGRLSFATGAPVVPVVGHHPGPRMRLRVGTPLRPEAFADPAAITAALAAWASVEILAAPEVYHDHTWLWQLWAPRG
jgi:lauroyl/myristoyl acyltransferase